MRALSLFPLLLVACVPASAVLVEPDPVDDTDAGLDTDVDTGGDTDPGTDPDTDVDTEPDTEPAPLRWSGTRDFVFDTFAGDCADMLVETGDEITEDPAWAEARQTCQGCEHIFYIETDKDRLCAGNGFPGFPVATPIVRGVDFVGGGEFILWAIGRNDRGEWGRYELANGERAGSQLTYTYDGEIWGSAYEVEGEAILQ